jgi:hypothetical protein
MGTSGPNRVLGDRFFPNAARVFFALWYLLGSLVHIKFGLTDNHIYEMFGRTSLLPASREVWTSFVMPHITFLAMVLACFEMTTGILILSKGKYVKIGLTASLLFNLFLVQLGLGYAVPQWSVSDLVQNRLANLLFVALQLPLFWVGFDKNLLELVRRRPRR